MAESSDRGTLEEARNIELVQEYMLIAYDPRRASAEAVAHLCTPRNTFIAPTTFPNVHTLEQYAEDHGKLMKQVSDLHLVSFDLLRAGASGLPEIHRRGEPFRRAAWGHPADQEEGPVDGGRALPDRGRQARRVHQGVGQALQVGAARLAARRMHEPGRSGSVIRARSRGPSRCNRAVPARPGGGGRPMMGRGDPA